MIFYEIPMTPQAQKFSIPLGGITYNLTVQWRDAPLGGWVLDIADADSNPLKSGLALVTGNNLLENYAFLGIPGGLTVTTDGDLYAPPTFTNLGVSSHIWFITGP